jgi:signal transduction histidine kinase
LDTKLKNFSHSIVVKIITFAVVIACFTGVFSIIADNIVNRTGYIGIAFEDNFYQSDKFHNDTTEVINILKKIIIKYKNEQNILNGACITEARVKEQKEKLYSDFRKNSNYYSPSITYEENYKKFEEVYQSKIAEINQYLISEDLKQYNMYLDQLKEYQGIEYFAGDGVNQVTNCTDTSKEYFKSKPCYFLYDQSTREVYPNDIKKNRLYNDTNNSDELSYSNCIMYVAVNDDYLSPAISVWEDNKKSINGYIYLGLALLVGLAISFIYLAVIIGKKSFDDKEVHFNFIDKIYSEFNMLFCIILICIWAVTISSLMSSNIDQLIIPVTASIAIVGLVLVLSLIKHLKNGTFIKHTLVYTIMHKIYTLVKDIYNSGNIGAKVVFIILLYSAILGVTFFIFPITIGIGIWFAIKETKKFNEIKEGVKKVKEGNLNYKINLAGDGELGNLAADINSITDGLNNAVENELKSQRLRTELITNVSHDIRTPLTSIITYIDLLKNEKDDKKANEYIEIIEEKAHRLKVLTDDLFEASKASSKDIPVNLEKIDVVSLITQGFGELNDKIQQQQLDFKVNYPTNKVFIIADGKLFWRVIENLLSNIFKYALKGSRVYIDIEEAHDEVKITVKNISAYELNISSDELMERFKRGDEARNTQGSGLGLSIAKSLVENQNGKFDIEIDGDLFKAIIIMPTK